MHNWLSANIAIAVAILGKLIVAVEGDSRSEHSQGLAKRSRSEVGDEPGDAGWVCGKKFCFAGCMREREKPRTPAKRVGKDRRVDFV